MEDCKNHPPLLSIVIPTRNRLHYVKSAITSILDINDPRIELVIQDNSDSNELMTWVGNNFNDIRLKYNYSELPLSFVGNFNEAISFTNGKFVCLIGDDDGINPELPFVVDWMDKADIDSLSTKISASYVWQNSGVPSTKFTKITGGVLSIADFSFSLFESNLDKQLELFFKNGCHDYLQFGLPKLYQGIIRKECLEKVKKITGNYFGGLSPDIFASVSLSLVSKKVIVTDYPLIISGVCRESASIIEGLLKKNSKKVEDAPHLRNRGTYHWDKAVPYIYTVETIWADSAIAAAKLMGANSLIDNFDVPIFSAYCVFYNKGIFDQVFTCLYLNLKSDDKNIFIGLSKFYLTLIKLKTIKAINFFKRILNRILIIFGIKKIIRFEGIDNIEVATQTLIKYLYVNNITFTKTNYKSIQS